MDIQDMDVDEEPAMEVDMEIQSSYDFPVATSSPKRKKTVEKDADLEGCIFAFRCFYEQESVYVRFDRRRREVGVAEITLRLAQQIFQSTGEWREFTGLRMKIGDNPKTTYALDQIIILTSEQVRRGFSFYILPRLY